VASFDTGIDSRTLEPHDPPPTALLIHPVFVLVEYPYLTGSPDFDRSELYSIKFY
jgi:hypothetical protein